MKKIIGIACVDNNGFYCPNDGGHLVWPKEEGDLDWFKYITNGNIILLGKNSYNLLKELPPLKNREIWSVGSEGCDFKNFEEARLYYESLETDKLLFVGGGRRLWEEAKLYWDYFYLTVLHKKWIEEGKEPFDIGKYHFIKIVGNNTYSICCIKMFHS